jgi:hypothetical protein
MKLIYLMLTRLAAWMVLLTRSETANQVEILTTPSFGHPQDPVEPPEDRVDVRPDGEEQQVSDVGRVSGTHRARASRNMLSRPTSIPSLSARRAAARPASARTRATSRTPPARAGHPRARRRPGAATTGQQDHMGVLIQPGSLHDRVTRRTVITQSA